MLNNYFKIALRSLLRQKGYSPITIVGLAVGISSCLLLWLYVSNELQYDKQHTNADRIYRLTSTMTLSGQTSVLARSSYMLGHMLKKDYPEVEEFARIIMLNS